MTIDEVEKIYKAITNEGTPCPRYCMLPCDKCVQECKQVLEWLEELKAYKEKPDGWMWDEAERKGYNKAIDDFVKFANTMPTVEEDDGTIRPMWLEEMAEKLKEGASNGNKNQ